DVHAVLVAAASPEIQLIRTVGEPAADRDLVVRAAEAATAAAEAAAADGTEVLAEDAHPLILPRAIVELLHLAGLHVEDEKLRLRDVLLTRHVVLVGLELRPALTRHVHDPKVADVATVLAREREPARIVRPRDLRRLALLVLLARLVVRLAATLVAVAVVLDAIRRQLRLLYLHARLRRVRLLARLAAPCVEDLPVLGVRHHPQVELAAEHDDGRVGRHA